MKANLLVVELNEFNRDLLVGAAQKFDFENLKWLTNLKETTTWTDDTYESDWLEPWSQWVSVHTGLKSSQHKIKHLGDVPDLNVPQVWEALSAKGVSTGVWGVLNGKKGNAQHCHFFIPDPWTFSENESPENLRGLIEFPRYFAKNRVSANPLTILNTLFKLLTKLPLKAYIELLKSSNSILSALIAFRFSFSGLFLIFEYAATVTFAELMKKSHPRVGVLFLNSIAHIQHYYWQEKDFSNNKRLYWLFYFVDKCIGALRSELPNYSIVALNALSQQNTSDEAPWILYRAKDYKPLFEKIGISPTQIEPLMSYDATLFFKNRTDRDAAAAKLSATQVNGKPLFKVETEGHPENRLFFRIDFFDSVEPETSFSTPTGAQVRFFDYFSKIIQRTAKHNQLGSIFSEEILFPKKIYNHEFHDQIMSHAK